MKELFLLLKQKNLSPNGYYILYSLESKEKLDLTIPYSAEITRLKHNGFLDENTNLTNEAKIILIEAARIFIKQSKTVHDELGADFTENVKKYRETFPPGLKSNRMLRTGITDLSPRFVWFFKTYPQITWEQVFLATEKYVESFGKDLTYCKSASYFIKKDDKTRNSISDLATWCEGLTEEDSEPSGDFGGFYEVL